MTGAELGGGILVDVGIAIIERAGPSALTFLKSLLRGKRVLILGQARAGKSTFRDYLEHGIFEDERETDKTPEVKPGPRFTIKVGRNAALELSFKTVVDTPGQVGPVEHANLAYQHRPHALLIFTDLTSPLHGEPERASATWLSEFCRRLESKWRVNEQKRTNRIKSVILIMNKSDKVGKDIVDLHKKEFRTIFTTELRDARGKMIDEVEIRPCTLVTNPQGTRAVDSIIVHLAKALAR